MKEFDNTEEFSQIRDEKPSKEEFNRIKMKQEIHCASNVRDSGKHTGKNRNFLLQAASVMTAGVLVTTAFGNDILGTNSLFEGGLSDAKLTSILEESGAKEGVITVSMMWSTIDDLDLHVVTPQGDEIFFGNPEAAGGHLDIDRQVGEFVDYPVENIYFDEPQLGKYTVFVENFCDRTVDATAVLVRVVVSGQTKMYRLKVGGVGEREVVCEFEY